MILVDDFWHFELAGLGQKSQLAGTRGERMGRRSGAVLEIWGKAAERHKRIKRA